MSKFIVSDVALQALYDAGLIDDPKNTRRIIIDLEVGAAAKFYVDKFADDVFLDVVRDGAIRFAETEEEAGKVGPLREDVA